MSKQSAKKFFEKLEVESNLAAKVKAAHQPDDVVVLAKKAGFDFTAEEYVAELIAMKANLGDGSLSAVVGGAGKKGGITVKAPSKGAAADEDPECW